MLNAETQSREISHGSDFVRPVAPGLNGGSVLTFGIYFLTGASLGSSNIT